MEKNMLSISLSEISKLVEEESAKDEIRLRVVFNCLFLIEDYICISQEEDSYVLSPFFLEELCKLIKMPYRKFEHQTPAMRLSLLSNFLQTSYQDEELILTVRLKDNTVSSIVRRPAMLNREVIKAVQKFNLECPMCLENFKFLDKDIMFLSFTTGDRVEGKSPTGKQKDSYWTRFGRYRQSSSSQIYSYTPGLAVFNSESGNNDSNAFRT